METKGVSLVCVALLTCVACSKSIGSKESEAMVKIATIESSDEQDTSQYPGRVKAAQDVSLAFRVSGVLERILADEGVHVSKGQLLAEIDETDYKVQLDATEAEYWQVKAEAERVIALYNDSGTTANTYDKATYGLQQMEAKYRHAQDELSYTKLYAPFAGYVQKHLFEAHETVGAGTPVITLISDGEPEVEINLPAAEYVRRSEFGTYSCTFDVYHDVEYPLQFISIAPKANANQLYTMRLKLEVGDKPKPSPGMNTMVTISHKGGSVTTFTVPTSAILQDKGQCNLFVFNPADSIVSIVGVTAVRLLSNGQSLITTEALKAGDKIVISGVHHINDGEKVRPMTEASDTNMGGLL